MRFLPRWAWWAFALICFGGGCAHAQIRRVLLDAPLIAHLDSIADTASIEHYRCLLGQRRSDSLLVYAAWEPPIAYADYNGITPALRCPDGTLGEWHNHLPYYIPMILGGAKTDSLGPIQRVRVEPWSACDLSPVDRRSALEHSNPDYQLLSVANGVHCQWRRLDDSTLQRIPEVAR